MKRVAVTVVIAAGFWFAVQGGGSAQQVAPASASGWQPIHATAPADLREWDGFVTTASRSGALRLRSVNRDPALSTRTVERFDQFHRGVRIWGADIVRDSERGVPHSIFGVVTEDLTLDVEPGLGAAGARGALQRLGGDEARLLQEPELTILQLDGGRVALAYTAVVAGGSQIFRAFVDAGTGVELKRYSEIQTQESAVGTGHGVLGDEKKLSVQRSGGVFRAFDRHRPPVIETFDMRGILPRAKMLLVGRAPYTLEDLATDSDNVWTDLAVVDAHVHVSWTYDYYFKRFGRNGLDGRNSPIDVMVNAVSQQASLSLTDEDLFTFALNAFYCGTCGPGGRGLMHFGSGLPSNVTLGGQTWTYLSGALDVAAHELTHAVTDATSRLVYSGESGALNEAFSDIMGKGVEFFYHPPGSAPGQADYVLGKDVIRSARPGVPSGIRSLANPGLFGDPDHYSRRYTGQEDDGGVHINSGIANQAFFLAVEGGTNRTSGLSVQGVGAANRAQIEQVFYRAFTLLMPSSSTFATARAATIQAARDLYGAGGAVELAVLQAWTAVGVS